MLTLYIMSSRSRSRTGRQPRGENRILFLTCVICTQSATVRSKMREADTLGVNLFEQPANYRRFSMSACLEVRRPAVWLATLVSILLASATRLEAQTGLKK